MKREPRAAEGLPARRQRWPWVIAILLIIGAVGYGYYTSTRTPQAVAVAPVETVESAMQINDDEWTKLEGERLERRVRVTRTLGPWRSTQISSQTSGEIQ